MDAKSKIGNMFLTYYRDIILCMIVPESFDSATY